MPDDKELPSRFAKLVLTELADIKATVLSLAIFTLADMASRKEGGSNERASEMFESLRKKQAKEISADLLRQLGLAE